MTKGVSYGGGRPPVPPGVKPTPPRWRKRRRALPVAKASEKTEVKYSKSRLVVMHASMTEEEIETIRLATQGSSSRSGFIRKAVFFYIGYLEGCKEALEIQAIADGLQSLANETTEKKRLAAAQKKLTSLRKEASLKRKKL